MKYLLLSCLIALTSCGKVCKDDMEFGIKYKTVDGSWEGPLYWDLPHDSKISIQDNNGAYHMGYNSPCKGGNYHWVKMRNAVIDFRIVSKKMLYDTTKTKVELIEPDTLK